MDRHKLQLGMVEVLSFPNAILPESYCDFRNRLRGGNGYTWIPYPLGLSQCPKSRIGGRASNVVFHAGFLKHVFPSAWHTACFL